MGDGSRRSKKQQAQGLQEMPREIVMNILSRLSWQDLLQRARYVCRKWYLYVRDNDFAHLHMEHTTISSSTYELVTMSYEERRSLFHIFFHTIRGFEPPWGFIDDRRYEIRVSGKLSIDYNFVGSINGLISFHKVNTNTAFVFNPLTKAMVTLPPNKPYKLAGPSWSNVPNDEYGVDVGWLSATGFGFCDVNKEYKLVHVYLLDPMLQSSDHKHHHVIEVEMICLGVDRCWRKPKGKNTKCVVPPLLPVGNAVVIGNVMYWLGYFVRPNIPDHISWSKGIVWFDLSSEDFGVIGCPYEAPSGCYNQALVNGDGQLSLVCHCYADSTEGQGHIELVLWTLKDPLMQTSKWVEQPSQYLIFNQPLRHPLSAAVCIRRGVYVVTYFCNIRDRFLVHLLSGQEDLPIYVRFPEAAVVPYQPSLVYPPTTPTAN